MRIKMASILSRYFVSFCVYYPYTGPGDRTRTYDLMITNSIQLKSTEYHRATLTDIYWPLCDRSPLGDTPNMHRVATFLATLPFDLLKHHSQDMWSRVSLSS